jgi:hypothetical protein
MTQHSQAIYDRDGIKIIQTNPRFADLGEPDNIEDVLSRETLNRLIQTAESLSKEIDYTRVDLFLCGDKIYFGEYTNYHNSATPLSDEWETLGGKLWAEVASKEEGQ